MTDAERIAELEAQKEILHSAWRAAETQAAIYVVARDAAEAQVQALQQALMECLAALYEVVHHADDECGFMTPVWSAIQKAEAVRAVAGDPAQEPKV